MAAIPRASAHQHHSLLLHGSALHADRETAPTLPSQVMRAISAYGYANRHPEDAHGIARAYRNLVAAIGRAYVPTAASLPPSKQPSAHPLTAEEARHAARLWFASPKPSMTLAEWRDHFLSLHLVGIRANDWQERQQRTTDWNHAFAAGVAAEIAGGIHHG
ncbi:hypothetical protein [Castellaniella sp.]|uniref:hypothetical protein n=1 Tax=Castellaniella sp. TaxID=1955812 RepID=UPI002AFEE91A|nr:hypothetical protein [Castellaniella sp.]